MGQPQRKIAVKLFAKYRSFVKLIASHFPHMTVGGDNTVAYVLMRSSFGARSVEMDSTHCFAKYKAGVEAFKILDNIWQLCNGDWDEFHRHIQLKNETKKSCKCPSRSPAWVCCFKVLFRQSADVIVLPTKKHAKRKAAQLLPGAEEKEENTNCSVVFKGGGVEIVIKGPKRKAYTITV